MENHSKSVSSGCVKEIFNELEEVLKFTETKDKSQNEETKTFEDMTNEECLGYISIRTHDIQNEDFLAIDEGHSECIKALRILHSNITRRPLLVDSNENIYL